MSLSKSESLLGLTESFFQNYLRNTRGASAHTVRAYRDTLKLFYLFVANQKRKPVADLALDDIRADAVLAFLDHVESRRGNSAATRNCRLAAVRSFVQHLLRQDVTRAGQYGCILAIRNKKAIRRAAIYLEPEEARAVIGAIDRRDRNGERDHALLLFLYNTERESAKHWPYEAVIFGWKSRDKCVCSAKAKRNVSVPSGLKLHQLFVGSRAPESPMIASSGIPVNSRLHAMGSHICCGNTCGLQLSTRPHCESDASLHTSCATAVRLLSFKQALMCPSSEIISVMHRWLLQADT